MEMISLYKWAKREGIHISQAQKHFDNGKITGGIKENGKSFVPEDFHLVRDLIPCAICGQMVAQITTSHLSLHKMSLAEYKNNFPNSPIVSESVSKSISDKITGIVRSEEFKEKVSQNRSGIPAHNKKK